MIFKFTINLLRLMKKSNVIFYLNIVLLSSMLFSCSSSDDSYSPYYYSLKIRIEDKSGNDKIQGIDYIENNKAENQTYEIKKSLYNMEVTQTGKPKEDLFLAPLSIQKTDIYDCLVVTTSTLPLANYRPSQLSHKLICSFIFGDENEHIITSTWEQKNPVLSLCANIIVDGITYQVAETDKEGNPVFIVLLDK